MTFKKANNLTGWIVFSIALITYHLTREARGSLWDCGEFVSCAAKLELPHPPGAPLFTLLGRFFIIIFGDRPDTIASAVNFMSALASAATILFLFWTITHFADRLVRNDRREIETGHWWTVLGAGAVGALAYTFSDSFWFSAVEGEVYALSSFFTALVFWAILKWEQADELAGNDPEKRLRSDRWIVLLFFMMGLSIGVHLLNLLTIPAIVMVYYYRRFQVTTKGAIYAFLIGCAITGVVQVGVIQYSMRAASLFDVFFVNDLGLPFFSGFAVYFLLLTGLIGWALSFSSQSFTRNKMIGWLVGFLFLTLLPFIIVPGEGWKILSLIVVIALAIVISMKLRAGALPSLKLGLWCYTFMMLGYFMYFTTLIRSNANPPIDMNNVDNPISLVEYLSREQYGSAPLIYGPHFAATQDDLDPEEPTIRNPDKYIRLGDKYASIKGVLEYNFKSEAKMLFPRVWDNSNEQGHADFYADWLGLGRDNKGQYEAPTFGDNLNWFFSYQMSFMYWRYFLWNFAGKQNDVQGFGNYRDGNWKTGFSFADDKRLGEQSKLPETLQNNKANNKLYLLPFLLGILGCIYQYLHHKKDWIVSFLLFFFTGIAIVLYLNQPGNQPRERDYAYVGSFFAFAIWIGLSIVAIVQLIRSAQLQTALKSVLYNGAIVSFLVILMSCFPAPGGTALFTGAFAAALFAATTLTVVMLGRWVSAKGTKLIPATALATAIGLGVTALMAQQEWDDHDRSQKTTAPDLGRDYLESCPPNAILFTFGDNDTYPLWYAQEVEGVRPDVRVINTSLLQSDYYINQLRYKSNESDSMDVIYRPDQIAGTNLYTIGYAKRPEISPSQYYYLEEILRLYVGTDDPGKMDNSRGTPQPIFPTRNLSIPVDTSVVSKSSWINPQDSLVNEVKFTIPGEQVSFSRSDLTILSVVATTKWKRPVCFTSPYSKFGWNPYYRKNGLVYQLTPVANKFNYSAWELDNSLRAEGLWASGISNMNLPFTYELLTKRFRLAGAEKPGVYFDAENRRHLMDMREAYSEAAGNMADAGNLELAGKLLDLIDKGMKESNMPYAMPSRYNQHNQKGLLFLEAAHKAKKTDLAERIGKSLRADLLQQREYNTNNRIFNQSSINADQDDRINDAMLKTLENIEMKYKSPKPVAPEPVKGAEPR
ncbi:MAG: protein O-mannosyl-transferase family [Bacteroidota bacterium]